MTDEKLNKIRAIRQLNKTYRDRIEKELKELEDMCTPVTTTNNLTFGDYIGIDAGTGWDDKQTFEASKIFKVAYSYHDIGTDLGQIIYPDTVSLEERFKMLKAPTKLNEWENPMYNFYDRYSKWSHINKLVLGIQSFKIFKTDWRVWPATGLVDDDFKDISSPVVRDYFKKYWLQLLQMFSGSGELPALPFDEVYICVGQESWDKKMKKTVDAMYYGAMDAWKEFYPDGDHKIKLCSGAVQGWNKDGKIHNGEHLNDYVLQIPNEVWPSIDYLTTHPYCMTNSYVLNGYPEGDNEGKYFKQITKFGKPVLITEDGYNYPESMKFDMLLRAAILRYNEGAKMYCYYDLLQRVGDGVFHNTGLTEKINVTKDSGDLYKRKSYDNLESFLVQFGDIPIPTIKEETEDYVWATSSNGREEYNFAWLKTDIPTKRFSHLKAGVLSYSVKIWIT